MIIAVAFFGTSVAFSVPNIENERSSSSEIPGRLSNTSSAQSYVDDGFKNVGDLNNSIKHGQESAITADELSHVMFIVLKADKVENRDKNLELYARLLDKIVNDNNGIDKNVSKLYDLGNLNKLPDDIPDLNKKHNVEYVYKKRQHENTSINLIPETPYKIEKSVNIEEEYFQNILENGDVDNKIRIPDVEYREEDMTFYYDGTEEGDDPKNTTYRVETTLYNGKGYPNSTDGESVNSSSSSEVQHQAANLERRNHNTERYQLFILDYDRVHSPFIICLWVLMAMVAKMGEYFNNPFYS